MIPISSSRHFLLFCYAGRVVLLVAARKESVLLVSRSDQSTEFLLWQHERSGVRSWKGGKGGKGGWKGIMIHWSALFFHSQDDKRLHDGRFAEYFNLGRKLSFSTSGGVSIYFVRYPDIYDTIFCFSAGYFSFISQKSEFMNIPEQTLARPACNRRHDTHITSLTWVWLFKSCIWATFFLVASTICDYI